MQRYYCANCKKFSASSSRLKYLINCDCPNCGIPLVESDPHDSNYMTQQKLAEETQTPWEGFDVGLAGTCISD